MRLQLEILAKWLKDHKESWDERDGALESAIKRSKEDNMFQIGDYLEDILEMNTDQLEDVGISGSTRLETTENERISRVGYFKQYTDNNNFSHAILICYLNSKHTKMFVIINY